MDEFITADLWGILSDAAPEETVRARQLFILAHEGASAGVPSDNAVLEAALRDDLTKLQQEEQRNADALLKELSPNIVAVILAEDLLSDPSVRILSEHVGMSRFLWTIAVGASGEGDGSHLAVRYLECASRWCAFHFLLSLLGPRDSVTDSIAKNPSFEAIRRQMPSQTRFAWVSQLLLQTANEVCRADPHKYGTLSQKLTEDATSGMFDFLRALAYADSHLAMFHWAAQVGDAARELMRAMSLKCGALSYVPFADLVLGSQAEVFPFVDFGGDYVVPLAGREAALATEVCLFELARRELPDLSARGDLYEEVLTHCLRAVASDAMDVLNSPTNVSIPQSTDPGEVDFAIVSKHALVVGEAKAYLVPRGAGSVVNAFGTQVKTASEQLHKRMHALTSGVLMVSAVEKGGPQELQTDLGDRRLLGIGVTLHAYATAIWNRDALDEIGAFREGLAIIPIHQLILSISLLNSDRDLVDYLDFRHHLMAAGVRIFDEADILWAYLGNAEGVREQVQGASEGQQPMLRPTSVSHPCALTLDRPRDRSFWRELFSSLVSPIHLSMNE